jgi:hypothetical protein
MNRKDSDTSWEAAVQKRRKRMQSIFFFFIPLAIIIAIILNNNRDLFESGQSQVVKKNNFSTAQESPVVKVSEPANSKKVEIRDSVKLKPGVPEPRLTQTKKAVLPAKTVSDSETVKTSKCKSVVSKKENIPAVQPVKLSSVSTVSLQGIDCKVNDRKDLRITLDLDVQFGNELMRKEILIKRDDLKVLVIKTLSKKSLSGVNKEQLRGELIDAMNGIFDHRTITGVVIKNLQIEKADKP